MRLTIERYSFMLTRDVGSIFVKVGKKNRLRAYLAYVKAYNINYKLFYTLLDWSASTFGNEYLKALGFDQKHIN